MLNVQSCTTDLKVIVIVPAALCAACPVGVCMHGNFRYVYDARDTDLVASSR